MSTDPVSRELSAVRERVADMLAENDACGPGPISRGEYLHDADALIALILEGFAQTVYDHRREPDKLLCDVQSIQRSLRDLEPNDGA